MNLGKSKRYRYSAFHCTSILTSSTVKDHSWVMEVGSGGLSASSRHQPSFLGLRRVLGGRVSVDLLLLITMMKLQLEPGSHVGSIRLGIDLSLNA